MLVARRSTPGQRLSEGRGRCCHGRASSQASEAEVGEVAHARGETALVAQMINRTVVNQRLPQFHNAASCPILLAVAPTNECRVDLLTGVFPRTSAQPFARAVNRRCSTDTNPGPSSFFDTSHCFASRASSLIFLVHPLNLRLISPPIALTLALASFPPPSFNMSKTISMQEVKAHASPATGMYIIVDEIVYDVTHFVDEHPGGAKILKRVAGKDATKQFWKCESLPCLFKTNMKRD